MTLPSIELPEFSRKHRNFHQRLAEYDLAGHAYRVELVGRIGALSWPAICANCGTDTGERFRVRKVFVRPRAIVNRRYRSYQWRTITGADVPYCADCTARHRTLVPPHHLLAAAWRVLWPVLIPIFGASWCFLISFRIALAEQARGSGLLPKFLLAVPSFFGLIVLWCLVIAWWSSRAERVERLTEVTKACDFSDDVSWIWERERRIYALRNERFARSFAEANASRAWTEDDDRRSARTLTLALAVGGVAAVLVWAVVVLAPI